MVENGYGANPQLLRDSGSIIIAMEKKYIFGDV
jgi:hypothetical protein